MSRTTHYKNKLQQPSVIANQINIDEIDIDQVHRDFYELFTSNPNKDMLRYAYQNAKTYDEVTTSPDYYLFREEVELIAQNQEKLSSYLSDVQIAVELGPGSSNGLAKKTLPLLSYMKNLTTYVAVDISESYLENIGKYMKEHTDLTIQLAKHDFVQQQINISQNRTQQKVILLLGSTLGGFDAPERKKCLQNLAVMANPADLVLLTADVNNDEETLIKAYNGKAGHAFISSIFGYYSGLNINFKPYTDVFEITVTWDINSSAVKSWFKPTKDCEFDVIGHGSVVLNNNQKFQCVRSHKFNESIIKEELIKTGFAILGILTYNNMVMFVAKKI